MSEHNRIETENKSNTNPLISIITGVFNGEKYLAQTIESVLNQTYSNIEYIIIDGKSTDGTVEIIKRYESRLAYWKSEKDTGLYHAWNKGLVVAKGEWIGFLGADDIYYPDAISNYVNYINESRPLEFEFVSSKIELVNNDLKLKRIKGSAWDWRAFQIYMNAAHVGALHHKSLFEKYGQFNTEYKISGDYELLLRARDRLKAGFMDTITVKMRNEDGLSVTGYKPHFETRLAKIKSGGRNIVAANYELLMAILKMNVRVLIDKIIN